MKHFTSNFFITSIKKYGFICGIATGIAVSAIYPLLSETQQSEKVIQTSSLVSVTADKPTFPSSTPVCGLAAMPADNDLKGSFRSEENYNSAKENYQQRFPGTDEYPASWGGLVGRDHLIAVINSLGTEQTVSFRFAYDENIKKTVVYFRGGMFNPVNGKPSSTRLFLRTGSGNDAYCPPVCN